MKTASFFTFTGAGRVSIARFAPRNTPAGYRQYKALAPGAWFNSVTPAEYVKRFAEEILAKLDPPKVVADLEKLAGGAEPVLLCWEKPTDRVKDPTTFCHRAIVAEWLGEKLGLDVRELGYEDSVHPLSPSGVATKKGQLTLDI